MFTVCFIMFHSLTAVTPMSESCVRLNAKGVDKAIAKCEAQRDPLSTCEASRVGVMKWYIRTRQLGDE